MVHHLKLTIHNEGFRIVIIHDVKNLSLAVYLWQKMQLTSNRIWLSKTTQIVPWRRLKK